jgi:predicted nucleotidyltransferase
MRQLDEVRVLGESDRQLLRDLKSVILRFVPDATLILYGSVSRGRQGSESDYDLLVLLGASVPNVRLKI